MPPAAPSPWSPGRVLRWNDAEGWGFLAPDAGGADLFFHASALGAGARRPAPGDAVEFRAGIGPDGRPRAVAVRGERGWLALPALPVLPAAPTAFALAFLALVLTAGLVRGLPWWIVVGYGVASVVSAILYSFDKRCAEADGRRLSERTLHLVDLAGGWPGGLVASQALRHKTQKFSFRAVFWATAALHVLVWLAVLGGFRNWSWL